MLNEETRKRFQEALESPGWEPTYSHWRHGGWYVDNLHHPCGAVGCVSRNYADKKWRIVCDPRPRAHDLFTYKSRDAAAFAERELAIEHYRLGLGDYEAVRAHYRTEAVGPAPLTDSSEPS